MAVTLNVSLVCGRFIETENLLWELNKQKLDILINKQSCIDNWMWENQQVLRNDAEVQKALGEGKIVVINFDSSKVKDMGVYVEKDKDEYIYDFWVNTEGLQELDADRVNHKNKRYFQWIYEMIGDVLEKEDIKFKLSAVGIETVFKYANNVECTIRESDNVIAWVVKKDLIESNILLDFRRRDLDNLNIVIFER